MCQSARTCARPFAATVITTIALTAAFLIAGPGATAAERRLQDALPGVLNVNCDAGETIGRALGKAKAGETIHVRGTCRERVVLKSGITLDGGGSAVIDGGGAASSLAAIDPEFDGVVVIDGATDVTLVGLTIQNGRGNGVLGLHGASFAMRHVGLSGNVNAGVVVGDHSVAELTDSFSERNRLGFDVFNSSSLILRGTFSSAQNSFEGGDVFGASVLEIRGGQVAIADNGVAGLVVGDNSSLEIFAFAATANSTVAFSGHPAFGMLLLGGSALGLYNTSTMSAANNGIGLLVLSGDVTSPFGTANVLVENNGVGMSLGPAATVNMTGGLTARENGTGIFSDGAVILLDSMVGNPVVINSNAVDMDLQFGTRSRIQGEGLNVGAIVCDGTVLSRGTKTCP